MESKLKHRTASVRVQLVNLRQEPYSNAEIHVRQKEHDFLLGCGAFDSVNLTSPGQNADVEFYRDRMEKWLEVYNYGTLPFYWGKFEPQEGAPETLSRRKAAEYLRARGVVTKGHPLCWHTSCADWLLEYDNETILKKQLARIEREVGQFRGLIDTWDVINEVVIMPDFDRYDNAVTRLCRQYGRIGLVKMVFEEAKAANPDSTLLINDFNTTNAYQILIDGCLSAGVPIDVIGIQSHQHQGYWGKEKLESVLDRFSVFGLPIHFTENTLVSGTLMPPEIVDLNDFQVPEWPSLPEFEERQKREIVEMFRILFEHPLVEAVTQWDFADGAWLGAPSGVVRRDNSVKPAYTAVKELFRKSWWTDERVHTDENGMAVIQGFKGKYALRSGAQEAGLVLRETDLENVTRITL